MKSLFARGKRYWIVQAIGMALILVVYAICLKFFLG